MDTPRLRRTHIFKSFDIWKEIGKGKMVRYRFFEILPEQKFCIQSADFFSLPIGEKWLKNLEMQFLELLLECPPNERNKMFDTIEEAIKAHDEEFGN
jgi:hypothetical protein